MRALLYLLLISLNIVLPSVCFGQLVTTSNSIKEIISDDYHPKSGGTYFYNNPVNNWPACSVPSDLNFQLDGKGNLTLSWDGDEKQMQNYQYEIKFPEGVLNTDKNIVTVSRNKYNIRRTDIGPRSDFSVSVRRKCFINKEVFYSNWVTQEIILPEPANTNNATCPQLADLVYYVPNVLPEIKGNDTLKLHNSTYDTLWVKFNGVYWGPGLKSSDPKVLVKFSEVKKIPYGQIGVISVAKYHRVEASFLKAIYTGNALELNCPPVIFVKPKECITNVFVGYTKTTASNINNIQVKLYGGISNVSGFISSNQETVQFVNGQATISSCSEINIQLFSQNLVSGVLITESCDPIVIDNHCSCLEGFGITIRSLEVEQPTCSKSTGTIRLTVPGYLSSIGGEFANLNVYSNLQPGLFYLTLKDVETNCLTTPYLVIINEQPPIPEPPTCMVSQQSGCNGQKGIIEVTNPTLNFNYSLGTNFGTSTVFTNLNAGYYQISAKNPQGCISVSDTLWVEQGNTPATPQVTLTQPSCSPVVSTGTITFTSPTGSDYTYALNSGVFQTSPVFSGLLQGTYSVAVKSNVTGCTAVLSNIGINGVPNLPIPNVNIITQPSCTASTGSIFVSAPTGPQYTSFSIGGAFQSSRNFSNMQPGTYNVTVKTNTGCISSPRVIIINPNVPAASVTSQPTCTSILGAIGFTAPAGADFNYSISNGTSWQSGSTFSNLSPGTYLCKYKNTSTNCISQALTLVVNPPPTFAAPEVSLTQATCTDLFGSIQISSPLGSEYSYSINTVEPNFQSSPLFSNRQPGTYNVIVRNNNTQCYSQVTSVEIYPLPDIPDSPTFTLEQPNCFDLTGVINIDSPLGWEYEYSIDQQNFEAGIVFNNLLPGTYSVVAKHVNSNCLSSIQNAVINSVPEQIQDTPSINISQLDCLNTTGSITVENPLGNDYLYRINGGQYQSSPVFNNLEAGSYEVNYKMISSQCFSNVASGLVNNFNAGTNIGLSINSYDQTECNPNNSSINIISPLGSQYQYRLNEGEFQNQPIFSQLMPGDYKVEYRNSETGCVHPNFKIDKINGFPCEPEPEFICGVLSNFIGLIQFENSFTLQAPDNLLDILNSSNISSEGINYQLSFIKSLRIQLDYNENGNNVTKNFDIFDESMFTDLDGNQNFRIKDWTVLIENINTSNFSGTYKIIIAMKSGSVHHCDIVNLTLTNETIIDPDNTNNFPDLPVLDCNSVLPIGNTSSTVPKTTLSIGELIVIQAFPIKITEIDEPQNSSNGIYSSPYGIYSGKGILPIPFGSKNVLVEFFNVFVNEYGVISQGSVSVIRSEVLPIIANPAPLVIGGDICLPPPPPPSISGPGGVDPVTGLDAYGFDPGSGLHSNGTPYDDNNFDINGNYEGTNPPSPFNPAGCNRDGKDEKLNPCNPNYDADGPLKEVADFLQQNENQINDDIINQLNIIKNEALIEINTLNCNQIKLNVITYNTGLMYLPCFAIGQDNKYVNIPQLLTNYKEPIQKSELNASNKNAATKLMEDKHVDLYECAQKTVKYQMIIDVIDEILNDPEKITALKQYIKGEIERWSEEDAARYIGASNEDQFKTWLTKNIKSYISQYANNQELFGFNYKKPYRVLPIKTEVDYIDYYNSMASINNIFPELPDDVQKELDFYMRQDFQTIKGIDRAYYLEKMSKNISLNDLANNVHALPVKIDKQVGGLVLSLILDNITVTQNSGILDAYIVVEDSESGRKIVFKGLNIEFNTNGLIGNNKLSLGNDVEIRINNAAKLILKGNTDTYVQFNCAGFAGMGIDADVEFCRNFIVPLNATLNTISDTSRYRLSLKTTMTKWLDFSFTINAPPFALAKYDDIKFQLENMVIDMSSSYTPPMTLPKGYQNALAGTPGWKGFYIDELQVTFPNEFSTDNVPAKVTVNDFIVDGTGVSGEGSYVGTILSLENGNIGGWGMSIEEVGLKFLHNHFERFSVKGQMEVPLFDEPFDYIGHIYTNNIYKFSVIPKVDLTCNLFLAEAELTEGSGVSIGHDNLGFNITANLNGKIRVKGSQNVPIELPEFEFEGVSLSNRAPYFSPGNWPIPEDAGLDYKGFELNLNEANLYKPDKDDPQSAGLYLNVSASLDSKFSIDLSGGFGITGKLEYVNGKQKWKFKEIKVHDFCIGGSFPGVDQVTGCLKFFEDDNDYGSGFKGGVYVSFSGFLSELKAIGQFGRFNGERYFFVDASASLAKSIPLFAGIELKGFSGGVSNRMTGNFNPNNINFEEPLEDFQTFSPTLGVGFSGITYSVDLNRGLGLKAGAMFNMAGEEEIFNGSLEIGMEFNQGGGLAKAYLNGIGQFLSPMNLTLPIKNPFTEQEFPPVEVESVLSAYIFLEWIPGKLSGKVEAFLNAGPLKGSGENGKMVNIALEFTSGSWHVYIGTPAERNGIDLALELFNLHFKSYLCMGSVIPDMPDLPENVRQIIPKIKSNSGLRGGGGGIVFGASFNAGVKLDLIGIITAKGDIEAGFDVMLRKYKNMTCAGGNGSLIGINGWYGAGQVYAYVTGELKILGFNVLKAGVAAALQARLPNPSWIQGTVGMYIDTWLYSGNFDLAISVGEECNIISTNPNNQIGIEVISSTNPINSAEDVNVDLSPEIHFSLPIDKLMSIKNVSGVSNNYMAQVNNLSLTYGDSNEKVEFTKKWENNKTVLKLKPLYFLPPNQAMKLIISVDVFENDIKVATEERIVNFITGEPLTNITESNIHSTYPLNGMKNFYKDEEKMEFIKLNQGLYDVLLNENFNVNLLLNDNIAIPVQISENATKIEFDISPYLSNETQYKLELIRYPKISSDAGSNPEEQSVLYTIDFRTSKYSTFAAKVAQLNTSVTGYNSYNGYFKSTDEPFDEFEYNGNDKYPKLVSVVAGVSSDFLDGIDDILRNGYHDDLLETYCKISSPVYLNYVDPRFTMGFIGSNGIIFSKFDRVYMNYENNMNQFWNGIATQVNGYYNTLVLKGCLPGNIPLNDFYGYKIAPKVNGSPSYYMVYRLPNGKQAVSTHLIND